MSMQKNEYGNYNLLETCKEICKRLDALEAKVFGVKGSAHLYPNDFPMDMSAFPKKTPVSGMTSTTFKAVPKVTPVGANKV
jgi:hypothetical protein